MPNAAAACLVGSIPSPSFNILHLGPLPLRLYGMCIALGVIAAVMITSRRWQARGGDPDDIGAIAIWAVPAGVIGARLYHVATDWKRYRGDWAQAFNITNGGLGIPGGIALGVIVGLIVARRRKLPTLVLLDMVAPALPVAQAIGRLGNWFNQELFGRPTSLPWGLRIDGEHAASVGYPNGGTFHPTFLYEALWNLALAGLLIVLDRRKKLRPGELFTLWVLGYAIGRLWVEELRIDPASLLLGVRVNIWMSAIVGLVAAIVFARNRLRSRPLVAGESVVGSSSVDRTIGTDEADGTDEDSAEVHDGADPGDEGAVMLGDDSVDHATGPKASRSDDVAGGGPGRPVAEDR